jgi:hypothetical protein
MVVTGIIHLHRMVAQRCFVYRHAPTIQSSPIPNTKMERNNPGILVHFAISRQRNWLEQGSFPTSQIFGF